MITQSQKNAINSLPSMGWKVFSVNECENGRIRVGVSTKDNFKDLDAFNSQLFIGKRGKIFENEFGDW